MREEHHFFMSAWSQLPARLDTEKAAMVLGFRPHDIPVLINARLLKPLGDPQPNGVKYFSAVTLRNHCQDEKWLSKATNAIYRFWSEKNGRRGTRRDGASEAAK